MASNDQAAAPLSIMGLNFFPRQWQAVVAPIEALLVVAGPEPARHVV